MMLILYSDKNNILCRITNYCYTLRKNKNLAIHYTAVEYHTDNGNIFQFSTPRILIIRGDYIIITVARRILQGSHYKTKTFGFDLFKIVRTRYFNLFV